MHVFLCSARSKSKQGNYPSDTKLSYCCQAYGQNFDLLYQGLLRRHHPSSPRGCSCRPPCSKMVLRLLLSLAIPVAISLARPSHGPVSRPHGRPASRSFRNPRTFVFIAHLSVEQRGAVHYRIAGFHRTHVLCPPFRLGRPGIKSGSSGQL